MATPTIPDWPSYTDDDLVNDNGTDINVALLDAIGNAIQAVITGADNPTTFAQEIIDEVIEARGSFSNLDDRISEPVVGTINDTVSASDIIDEVVIARDDNVDLNDRLDNFVADEIPDAGGAIRGLISEEDQTLDGVKTFTTQPLARPGAAITTTITLAGTITSDAVEHTATGANTETDATSVTLPANALNVNGKGVRITVWGKGLGATTKSVRFYWDGNVIIIPATFTLASWWALDILIARRAAGSQVIRANWRLGTGGGGVNSTTAVAATVNIVNVWDTGTEVDADETGPIVFKSTLKDTVTDTNIVQLGFVAELFG